MAKTISRKTMTQTVDGKVTRAPKGDEDSLKGKFFWWKKRDDGQEDDLANEIAATIKFMEDHQQGHRIIQLTMSTRLYGLNSAYNLIGTSFSRSSSANAS